MAGPGRGHSQSSLYLSGQKAPCNGRGRGGAGGARGDEPIPMAKLTQRYLELFGRKGLKTVWITRAWRA